MRLSLILGVCIVLCGAMVANATILPAFVTNGSFTISANVTVGAVAGFDRVDFFMTGLTGLATGGTGINILEGTFSNPGSTINLASDAAVSARNDDLGTAQTWVDFTDNGLGGSTQALLAAYGQVGPGSFVNFSSSANASLTGRVGTDEAFTSFAANWNNAGGALMVPGAGDTAATRIVRLFVPTGHYLGVKYTGDVGLDYGGGTVEHNVVLSLVPEPGTITLLAMGLVGLLAYAWRKR